MKAIIIVFLVVLSANAQTDHQMSRDFRTAGRRVLTANTRLSNCLAPGMCDIDEIMGLATKVNDACNEADAQRDNAADKQALELLKTYYQATLGLVVERAGHKDETHRALYLVCKPEVEQAFDTGLVPASPQCTRQ